MLSIDHNRALTVRLKNLHQLLFGFRLNRATLLRIGLFLGLSLCLALSACETLDSRLEKNKELFLSFPADHQEVIRQGQIKVGFTEAEVSLAWGKPTSIAITESTRGSMQTWIYSKAEIETRYHRQKIYNTQTNNWEEISTPFSRASEKITSTVIFLNGRVDSFTLYP